MSGTTSQGSSPPSGDAVSARSQTAQIQDASRYNLARWVMVGAFLTMFLLVGAMLATAQINKGIQEAEKAFTVLVPVLAGWVSTVLAFFFSAQSQERTNQLLQSQLDSNAAATARREVQPLSTAMIPAVKILKKVDLANPDAAPGKLTVGQIAKLFGTTTEVVAGVPAGGPVSRLIFVEGGEFRFVMHESALNAYWRQISTGENGAARDPAADTLEMMLKKELLTDSGRTFGALLTGSFVVQPGSATLKAAKAALDASPGAQDIIVTATGTPKEPLLGWLTNVDLLKQINGA